MARALFTTTPTRLIPQPDGSALPTAANGGTLVTFDASTEEMALFTGAVPNEDLCTVSILPDRVSQLEVHVDAYTTTGGIRVATGFAVVSAVRRGNGNVTLFGSPVLLTYDPNAAPWNTVTADLVVAANGTDVVVRTNSPNIPIRWRAQVKIIGAQAQVVS